MNIDPDQVLHELRDIIARLEALPADSPDRLRLEERRESLRNIARSAADAARNPDNLRAELEHLERRLESFETDKIEVPSWQLSLTRGGRLSLTNPVADAARINKAMEAGTAADRASIEARIARLRQVLDR